MTIFYIYALCFTALCGWGVVFLNAESILAACFFIFFGLAVQNWDSASEGLEETRQDILKQLTSNMLEDQWTNMNEQQQYSFERAELLKQFPRE